RTPMEAFERVRRRDAALAAQRAADRTATAAGVRIKEIATECARKWDNLIPPRQSSPSERRHPNDNRTWLVARSERPSAPSVTCRLGNRTPKVRHLLAEDIRLHDRQASRMSAFSRRCSLAGSRRDVLEVPRAVFFSPNGI